MTQGIHTWWQVLKKRSESEKKPVLCDKHMDARNCKEISEQGKQGKAV